MSPEVGRWPSETAWVETDGRNGTLPESPSLWGLFVLQNLSLEDLTVVGVLWALSEVRGTARLPLYLGVTDPRVELRGCSDLTGTSETGTGMFAHPCNGSEVKVSRQTKVRYYQTKS